ncbi:lycopene cyclase [Erythrobacter sp. QSSC1-22B]|uniref:lycopene beta-cyclase CrtY n=1 Tax=Erythrobacter sp. QSSC1-22B TaxID=1860125 RepID=UPI000804D253|nr:lycopene beta-cyclase CrtY [Erythrobacter sp. QSSC1-22B]OBX19172.1 lycopene cyclase [Erythrobacter sp. QSSC1-22B]
MNGRSLDIAVVGGGLAGGLIALAIHRAQPMQRIALIEAGGSFGGNHRWSWFTGDLETEGDALMAPFPQTSWPAGNTVRFPAHERHLSGEYRSLASADFDRALRRLLPQDAIMAGTRVERLCEHGVELAGGGFLDAATVIDCRDAVPSAHLTGGWQVFMGRHLRCDSPHGVVRPVIMDATVAQLGAYRFVYVLPLGPQDIFVEDTYYADEPLLDRATLSGRIAAYCAAHGWTGETIGEETGVLPVVTGGDFAAYRREIAVPGVALAGARGGFTHPLTSYTMPIAVANALAIAGNAHLAGGELARFVDRRAQDHWCATRFYRMLGKMLFDAAEPDRRYKIFERFYRLPEPLIERFYAARSTRLDQLRTLTGRPPVPIPRAIAALLGKGRPLVQG